MALSSRRLRNMPMLWVCYLESNFRRKSWTKGSRLHQVLQRLLHLPTDRIHARTAKRGRNEFTFPRNDTRSSSTAQSLLQRLPHNRHLPNSIRSAFRRQLEAIRSTNVLQSHRCSDSYSRATSKIFSLRRKELRNQKWTG